MMMMEVSGKNGNVLFRGAPFAARKRLPQQAERVTAAAISGSRAVDVSWRFSANACFKEPKVAEARITLYVAHASPDPDHTEGGRGEPMYSAAKFVIATFVDAPATEVEGSWRMELPSDADLLTAANSVIEDPRSNGAGRNLPAFVSRGDDGSVRLQLRLGLKAISEEGAIGWGECESASWEHTVSGDAKA